MRFMCRCCIWKWILFGWSLSMVVMGCLCCLLCSVVSIGNCFVCVWKSDWRWLVLLV